MSFKPYSEWKEERFYEQLELNFLTEKTELREKFNELIKLIREDKSFSYKDVDGCTLVQDPLHPSPACFIHDYLCKNKLNGFKTQRLFYYMSRQEGLSKFRASRRFIATLGYAKTISRFFYKINDYRDREDIIKLRNELYLLYKK